MIVKPSFRLESNNYEEDIHSMLQRAIFLNPSRPDFCIEGVKLHSPNSYTVPQWQWNMLPSDVPPESLNASSVLVLFFELDQFDDPSKARTNEIYILLAMVREIIACVIAMEILTCRVFQEVVHISKLINFVNNGQILGARSFSRRSFPRGFFPARSFSRWAFPRRSFPR